jgi:haloacetate dehalogenase
MVMTDLRGYGDSGKPDGGDNHVNYSKRAMAFDRSRSWGRSASSSSQSSATIAVPRVAHRLALDHPDKPTKLVLMDICPTLYAALFICGLLCLPDRSDGLSLSVVDRRWPP